jgi:hypothetical protein
MEKDFHYYLIYCIAAVTQHRDAQIMAFASQFVDDNNERQFFIDGKDCPFPAKIPANGGYYYPIMTQSLSPRSLDMYIHKYVYVPFHFLPGDDTVEIKGKRNKMNVTPNSENARALLNAALKSGNPYRIGVTLHTFTDTWSHQNFTGLWEDWNSVYPWYRLDKSYVPNIGHAEAGHSPDVISEIWTDYRLNKKIVNVERAYDAVRTIFRDLRKHSGTGPKWGDVRLTYQNILNVPDYDDRIRAMVDFTKSEAGVDIAKYDRDVWIEEALDVKDGETVMAPDFEHSHWHKFHQAAKDHFSHALTIITGL